MKLSSLRMVIPFAALAAALMPNAAALADARRAGLAGSALIEDRDDVYFFPQRLLLHPNVIELSYGGTGAAGTGLLTLGGESSVIAIGVHRGDVQDPHTLGATALGGPTSVFGAPFTVAPATIVDLLYGVRLGSSELGLRLSFGHGDDTTTVADMDSGESDTFITGEVGYGWGERGRSTRVDLSGAFTLDLASQEAADTDTASGTYFGVSALMRAFFPVDHTLDLGVLANARVQSNSVANETLPGDPASSQLDIGLLGGIGPALSFGRVSVAAYGILAISLSNQDPDTELPDNDTSSHTLVLPGVHMAVEVPLNDWLFVRTGAQYIFAMNGTSAPADSGSSQTGSAFGWNAGLGIAIEQFRFDGSLQQGFVTGGPDFIGGTGPGFLALATLSYSFDHLRHAQPSAPPPEFNPDVPPPPPPAPPPAQPGPEEPPAPSTLD